MYTHTRRGIHSTIKWRYCIYGCKLYINISTRVLSFFFISSQEILRLLLRYEVLYSYVCVRTRGPYSVIPLVLTFAVFHDSKRKQKLLKARVWKLLTAGCLQGMKRSQYSHNSIMLYYNNRVSPISFCTHPRLLVPRVHYTLAKVGNSRPA